MNRTLIKLEESVEMDVSELPARLAPAVRDLRRRTYVSVSSTLRGGDMLHFSFTGERRDDAELILVLWPAMAGGDAR